MVFDLDFGFGYTNSFSYNSLADALAEDSPHYYNAPCATFLLRSLLENNKFYEQFIKRFAELLNTEFQIDTVLNKIVEFEILYASEFNSHLARWHYPSSYDKWLENIDILKEFAKYRACYCFDHIKSQFNITDLGYTCDTLRITQINSDYKYSVFPNPCKDYIRIKSFDTVPEYISIEITDIMGKFLESTRLKMHKYADHKIDVSQLSDGIYFLKFIDYEYPQVIKIVVQN